MNVALHTRDQVYGWFGSILLHLVLLVIFFVWQLTPPPPAAPSTVAVTFIEQVPPPAVPTLAAKAAGSTARRPAKGAKTPPASTRRVQLPERSSTSRDQAIPLPNARKVDAPDVSGTMRRSTGSGGRKDVAAGKTGATARSESAVGTGGGTGRTQGTVVHGTGSSSLGTIRWIGGGKRRKLSGGLPQYPSGTNVEAQIRIEAVVTPAGSVKSARPAQKANARLEEAAMRVLRQWRFEPLARSLPQKDQRCVVTFNFKLR